jgi:hypothetical protein
MLTTVLSPRNTCQDLNPPHIGAGTWCNECRSSYTGRRSDHLERYHVQTIEVEDIFGLFGVAGEVVKVSREGDAFRCPCGAACAWPKAFKEHLRKKCTLIRSVSGAAGGGGATARWEHTARGGHAAAGGGQDQGEADGTAGAGEPYYKRRGAGRSCLVSRPILRAHHLVANLELGAVCCMPCGMVVGTRDNLLASLARHVVREHKVVPAGVTQDDYMRELPGVLGPVLHEVFCMAGGDCGSVQWEDHLLHYSKAPNEHHEDYPRVGPGDPMREPVEGVRVLKGLACPQRCCLSTSMKGLRLAMHRSGKHTGEGEGQWELPG